MASFDQVIMGLAELLDTKSRGHCTAGRGEADNFGGDVCDSERKISGADSHAGRRSRAIYGKNGIFKKRIEGYAQARWIVVDFGDVLVHIFHKQEREFYDIERLWKDKDNFLCV